MPDSRTAGPRTRASFSSFVVMENFARNRKTITNDRITTAGNRESSLVRIARESSAERANSLALFQADVLIERISEIG